MFDFFSWQHLSIMLIVALVVVGPKDLPRLMNMAGKWAGKARAMAGEDGVGVGLDRPELPLHLPGRTGPGEADRGRLRKGRHVLTLLRLRGAGG